MTDPLYLIIFSIVIVGVIASFLFVNYVCVVVVVIVCVCIGRW